MDDNDAANLDLEFKRYLQLLRPYLSQLADEDIIKICDEWIQRLSNCIESEKVIRNTYVFRLCYQLAKGVLEMPFVRKPPIKLLPLSDEVHSDDSSTEIECLVINSDEPKTKVLFDSKKTIISETDYLSQDDRTWSESIQSSDRLLKQKECGPSHPQTVLCYNCPNVTEAGYECRANNLVRKLREIKMQNILLHKELLVLKEESKSNNNEYVQDYITKVDHCTSPFLHSNDSNATLKSLKVRLQDIQDSRNVLIQTISNLQDQLDNFNELKKKQIEDIEAKHKLELIKVRTDAREETKSLFEKKFEELQQNYEQTITKIQETAGNEIRTVTKFKDEILFEKNKVIEDKNMEINKLKQQIENEKDSIQAMLSKFIEKSSEDSSCDGLRLKNQLLEKRLSKIEKAKIKCAKIYEAKIAQLQREKHLTECSLQLQLVKQRAQVVSEMTDENQTEISTSLDRLEAKYKDIVANVQATAIQRRIQDQKALESMLQTTCGVEDEHHRSPYSSSGRNHNQHFDSENTSRNNRVRHGDMNKSYGEDNVMANFYLNRERMGELFDKIYVPQKDDSNSKK